jgi:arabinogalactan oligomer/maltooligosaccharide transport system substrate-binding protein
MRVRARRGVVTAVRTTAVLVGLSIVVTACSKSSTPKTSTSTPQSSSSSASTAVSPSDSSSSSAGTESSSSPAATDSSSSSAAAVALPATELTWWDTSDPKNEGPTFKELVTKFNAVQPNVKINYQSVPFGDAQNKFKTAAAAKKGAPDILRADVGWVSEFASLGYLYDLDGTKLTENADDFLPAPAASTKFADKIYGVPQVTDSLALLYNKALFTKAGLDPTAPPKTWADVETAAKALKSKAKVDGIFINAGGYFILPFIYGEGTNLVDTTAKKITVNSPEAVKGVQTAEDLVKSGAAVKPPAQDSYGTMMTLFKEQKVAMIINGPWEVNNIKTADTFGGIDNLGIAPVPAGSVKAGGPVGGHDYVVWSGMDAAKADAAVAFIDFMSSAESQAFLADKLGLLPTRKSAYEIASVKANPIISAFQPVMQVAVDRAWIPEAGNLFGPLDEAATKVLVQGVPAKTALDATAKRYKAEVVKDYSAG